MSFNISFSSVFENPFLRAAGLGLVLSGCGVKPDNRIDSGYSPYYPSYDSGTHIDRYSRVDRGINDTGTRIDRYSQADRGISDSDVLPPARDGGVPDVAMDATVPTDAVVDDVNRLNGPMRIRVDRVALVTGTLEQPISTDPGRTLTPYVPTTVPIIFSSLANTVTLPAIPATAGFQLPRANADPLESLIRGAIVVTTRSDVSGRYPNITLANVPVHLQECFQADYEVTLTTGEAVFPAGSIPPDRLRLAGFHLTADRTRISGSQLDPTTLQVRLVGVSRFTNPMGDCSVAHGLDNVDAAIEMSATVIP